MALFVLILKYLYLPSLVNMKRLLFGAAFSMVNSMFTIVPYCLKQLYKYRTNISYVWPLWRIQLYTVGRQAAAATSTVSAAGDLRLSGWRTPHSHGRVMPRYARVTVGTLSHRITFSAVCANHARIILTGLLIFLDWSYCLILIL